MAYGIATIESDYHTFLISDAACVLQAKGVLHSSYGGIPSLAFIVPEIDPSGDISYSLFRVDRGDVITASLISPEVQRAYAQFFDAVFAEGYRIMDDPVLFIQRDDHDQISCFIAQSSIAKPLLESKSRIGLPGPKVQFNPFFMDFLRSFERIAEVASKGPSILIHAIMAAFGLVFASVFLAYLAIMGEIIIPRMANALQGIPWFEKTDYLTLYIIGMLFSVTDMFVFMTSRMRTITVVGWVSQGIGGIFHVWYGMTHPMGDGISYVISSAVFSVAVAFGGELALVFLLVVTVTLMRATCSFPFRLIAAVRHNARPSRISRRGHTFQAGHATIIDDAQESAL